MKKISVIVGLLLTLLLIKVGFAQNWKYFGGGEDPENKNIGIYGVFDRDSIVKNGNLVSIKTKWANSHTIFNIDDHKRTEILVQSIKNRLNKFYIPPYFLAQGKNDISEIDSNLLFMVILIEEIFNYEKYSLKLRLTSTYQIDCQEKAIRTLSTVFYNFDGKIEATDDVPTKWKLIDPDTIGGNIENQVCIKNFSSSA